MERRSRGQTACQLTLNHQPNGLYKLSEKEDLPIADTWGTPPKLFPK